MSMLSRKISTTVWFLLVSWTVSSQSQTWIVDNDPQAPAGTHIRSNLQDAIDAATEGDVVIVKGSPTPYANATIDKPLTLIGDGFREGGSKVAQLTIEMDASGTSIYGFDISNRIFFSGVGSVAFLSNVEIANNHINRIYFNASSTTDTLENLTIRSNIIGDRSSASAAEPIWLYPRLKGFINIENNVFYITYGDATGIIHVDGATISRNVFLGTGTQKAFDHIRDCDVSSNIFLGRSAEATDGTSSGNTFSNNISWQTADDDLLNVIGVIGTEAGENQKIDPLFSNLSPSASWNFNFNLEYAVSSPAAGFIGPDPQQFTLTGKWLPYISSLSGPFLVAQGSDLTLEISAEVDDNLHMSNILNSAEYFFDSDPGLGSGTDPLLSIGGTAYNGPLVVNTSELSPGNYVLYIRFEDIQRWGHYQKRLIQVYEPEDVGFDITFVEYFLDTDPGYASGLPLGAVTAGTSVDVTGAIPAASLNSGFHHLHIRAQDVFGRWGIPEHRLIYVDSLTNELHLIDELEVFFDRDPGYGNAVSIGDFVPAHTIDLVDLIPTDSLTFGFHTLYLRGRSGLNWGISEQRLVYVDQSGAVNLISEIEYFFDEDPGYGEGTMVSDLSTPSATVELDTIVSSSGLTPGFHTLYIRVNNGQWGIPEQRLVYIDQSGVVNLISEIEYFFDEDPGYGEGTTISAINTPSEAVDLDTIISSTGLMPGFHTLYIRAYSGRWGIPEQRLVYTDQAGNTIVNVAEFEYFFDVDPGYGTATKIPVTTPDGEVIRELFLTASSLPPGEHSVSVRAKDENGRWGLIESQSFLNLPPSRALDSVSLMVFYEETSGESWTNNTNWLTSQMDNWYGVHINNGRVDSLLLGNNNLDGSVSRQLGFLSELTYLDLAQNILKDTMPNTLEELNKLVTLKLHDNALHEIPDLSVITSLQTVSLDSNLFDFGDLEPLAMIPQLSYSNQKLYDDFPIDSVVAIGDGITLDKEVGGLENVYQWYLNEDPVPFADFVDHTISSFTAQDSGTYELRVLNTVIQDLELISQPFRLKISDPEEDSLALVSFYNSLNGDNWSNKANWLAGPMASWHGVTVDNDRITALDLPANALAGNLPPDFSYANALVRIDLSGNAITDTVPSSWQAFAVLEEVDLSDNDLTSLPVLNNLIQLNILDVSGNRLQFGDLEKNIGISAFNYLNQDSISVRKDTLVDANNDALLSFSVSGANNVYQWFKEEALLAGETANSLTIENMQFENEGNYRLQITNGLVDGLTLTSGLVNLGVTSLKRDSIALTRFYEATGGDDWVNRTNWLTSGIANWEGVALNENQTRVVSLTLPDNNLINAVPAKLRDITSMELMDFSGNELESSTNLSVMPNLSDLDLSDNRLGFAEILINIGIENFNYSPQKKIGEPEATKRPHGSAYEKALSVSGKQNDYQWLLNGNVLPEATLSKLTVDSLIYETMGTYSLQVTNTNAQDLTIESESISVLATADISVTSTGLNNELIEDGTGYLLQVTQPGSPFDSTAVVNPSMGEFIFEDVVLGDYLIALEADDAIYLPTYFENTYLWVEADTLELRENAFETISMTLKPGVLDPNDGDGKVYGVVEAEFDDEADAGERVNARRKVKKAGCSMRRFAGSGRTEEDEWVLIAYIETNDEGQFVFEDIPSGLYRFNIEYPGIPMDPDSFVEFVIGENGVENNTFILEAVVTEEGIEVVKVKELGFYRKYFKDLSIFPVPTDHVLNVKYAKLMSDQVKIRLIDLSGNIVFEQPLEKGYNKSIQFDTSGLGEGYYIIYFLNPEVSRESIITYKILVAH